MGNNETSGKLAKTAQLAISVAAARRCLNNDNKYTHNLAHWHSPKPFDLFGTGNGV